MNGAIVSAKGGPTYEGRSLMGHLKINKFLLWSYSRGDSKPCLTTSDLLIGLRQRGRAPMRSVSDRAVVSAKGGPAYERAAGSKLSATLSCSILKYTTSSIVYDVKDRLSL